MKNFLNKKISRLLVSKNVMKIFYYYHFLKGGFKSKKIDINFSDKKTRQQIVQNIIDLKRYENYLEIGTFKNDLFNYIKESPTPVISLRALIVNSPAIFLLYHTEPLASPIGSH